MDQEMEGRGTARRREAARYQVLAELAALITADGNPLAQIARPGGLEALQKTVAGMY